MKKFKIVFENKEMVIEAKRHADAVRFARTQNEKVLRISEIVEENSDEFLNAYNEIQKWIKYVDFVGEMNSLDFDGDWMKLIVIGASRGMNIDMSEKPSEEVINKAIEYINFIDSTGITYKKISRYL